jgi:anti-sigma-K factor RskA
VNIQEYISSGIIESYVLGLATTEERAEFERYCKQYPELATARDAFEQSLEQQAFDHAPLPPGKIREGFLSYIQHQPAKQGRIIPVMKSPAPVIGVNTWLKWVAAASVILFIISGYMAWHFYNQKTLLENDNESLITKLKAQDTAMNKMVSEQHIMMDPTMSVVNLSGTQKAPAASAAIYWDSTSAHVYLVVKNMPQLPSDKQYQLWALIDGKPKDLGLFDVHTNPLILKMNNTQKAEAFAITIEKRGNTGGPTLNQMQVMGKTRL